MNERENLGLETPNSHNEKSYPTVQNKTKQLVIWILKSYFES